MSRRKSPAHFKHKYLFWQFLQFLGVENTSVSASFFNALCDIIRESKKEQVITWK